jgi:hypothetical protein
MLVEIKHKKTAKLLRSWKQRCTIALLTRGEDKKHCLQKLL